MKRKTLIVLLVLLLVGILAFTVFACNNNKKPDNPGTTPGGDGTGPGDDPGDDDEEETYAIVEALPKLVTGLDKVAATVGDINEGKAAYLGADIGLVLGVTAEDVKAIDLDLGLSLKVSVDEKTSANNWALIGLNSGGEEVAQLFLTVEDDVEKIYIKEALTGSNNWKLLSVLDTKETDLEGLFTGDNYGLIDKLFGLISGLTAEDSTFPIDFGSATPISGIEFMEGFSLNTILGLVNTLNLGELLDGVLHAEAYDNGSGYTAELNRTGISALLTKLGPTIGTLAPDLDLYGMLRGLNPILSMVLGMSVKEEEDTFDIDDKANPKLTIDFNINDDAALENLSINFNNPDIEGLGIELGVAIKNIEIAGEARTADVDIPENTDDLGLNLGLELSIPAWKESAKIDISINPNAKIGFNTDGKVEIDLSNVDGYAKFNETIIAEYCTYIIKNEAEKGFAIDLGAVYDFIEPLEDGATETDLRDNIYFIKCDLDEIVYTAMYPNNGSGANNLSNAAYANEDEATGALAKLISAIKAGVSLNNINNVIGPILTDSNNLVGLLLGLFDGPITLDPALGEEDVDGSIKVTADLAELVEYVMNDNLLGGIEDMINISMYDVSAASTEGSNEDKTPYTLSQILDGQTDLVDVIIDLVYTATYEAAKKDGKATEGFNAYITSLGDSLITREKVVAYAKNLGITLDESVTAADFGNLVAAITYGEKGLSASISILGATLSLSADLDEYVDVADSIIGADADVKVITSWDEFNATGGLQNALMELAGYAMLNIEAETPAA